MKRLENIPSFLRLFRFALTFVAQILLSVAGLHTLIHTVHRSRHVISSDQTSPRPYPIFQEVGEFGLGFIEVPTYLRSLPMRSDGKQTKARGGVT